MIRRLFFLMIISSLGCASTGRAPRDPANLPAAATARPSPLAETFAEGEAVTALILTPPNARGEQIPICQVPLFDRPDLAPHFLKTTTSREPPPLKIAECSREQQNEIFRVAANAGRPVVAGPAQLAYQCAINIGVATSIMTAYTASYAKAENGSARRVVSPSTAIKTATLVVPGREWLKPGRDQGPRTLIAAVCTGVGGVAGQAIGYLITGAR